MRLTLDIKYWLTLARPSKTGLTCSIHNAIFSSALTKNLPGYDCVIKDYVCCVAAIALSQLCT